MSECYRCHSAVAKTLRGSLKLDSCAAMLRVGDTGPALVPGKAGESLIVQAIRHQKGLAMPPKKPRLPEAVIADFERWIALGAPMPNVGRRPGREMDATTHAGTGPFSP